MSKNRFDLDFTLWGNPQSKKEEKSCCPESLPDRQKQNANNPARIDTEEDAHDPQPVVPPEKRGFLTGVFITDPVPEFLKECTVEITAVKECKCAEISLFAVYEGNEYDLHELKQVHFKDGKARTTLKLYCDVDAPGMDGNFLNNYKKEKLTVDYFFRVKWRGYKELKSEILTMPVALPDVELQFITPVSTCGLHKQYVNLRQDDMCNGQNLNIRVGPKSENMKIQKVFWRITAGNENCTIQEEKPEIVKNGEIPVSFAFNTQKRTYEIETDAVNNEASMVLNCGCAGGDRLTIEIGTDGNNYRTSVVIENWRKLWYQLTYPEGMNKPPMEMVKEGYSDEFIELEEKDTTVIKQTDAFPPGTWVDGADIGLSPGKRLVIGKHNLQQIHGLFKGSAAPFELHLIFCDVMLEYADEKGLFMKSGNLLVEKNDLVKPENNNTPNKFYSFIAVHNNFEGNFIALPRALHNDQPSVFNISINAFDNNWNPKPLQGSLTYVPKSGEYYVNYVDYVNEGGRIYFQLPADAVPIIKNGGRVRINFEVYLADNSTAGQATANKIIITKRKSITEKASEERTAVVIMHEIGHAIGMASSKSKDFYQGKGHIGPHCSYGMISQKAKQGNYVWQSTVNSTKNSKYPCVMFGGDRFDIPTAFCENCSPIVKAQKMPEF